MAKPKLTLCPEDLDAVHGILREKLRQAGPGTIRRTEEALGLYPGYLRYHRHRRELDLGALLAILKRLKIRPVDFFDEVAAEVGTDFFLHGDDSGGSGPEPDPEPQADPEDTPPGAPPEDIPLTARAVLRRLGADLSVYGDFES